MQLNLRRVQSFPSFPGTSQGGVNASDAWLEDGTGGPPSSTEDGSSSGLGSIRLGSSRLGSDTLGRAASLQGGALPCIVNLPVTAERVSATTTASFISEARAAWPAGPERPSPMSALSRNASGPLDGRSTSVAASASLRADGGSLWGAPPLRRPVRRSHSSIFPAGQERPPSLSLALARDASGPLASLDGGPTSVAAGASHRADDGSPWGSGPPLRRPVRRSQSSLFPAGRVRPLSSTGMSLLDVALMPLRGKEGTSSSSLAENERLAWQDSQVCDAYQSWVPG